jgi:hypothetical protein
MMGKQRKQIQDTVMDCVGNANRDMTQFGLTEVGPQDL